VPIASRNALSGGVQSAYGFGCRGDSGKPQGESMMDARASKVAALAIGLLLAAGVAEASSTGRCGGSGGPRSTNVTCSSGQYVVGVSARGGSYVDQIGLRCASFDAAGKRIGQGSWKTGGPGGGSVSRDKTCAATEAVIQLDLKSGVYVDQMVEAKCRKRLAGGGFDETPRNYTRLNLEVGGFLGGRSCELQCPGGEALYGVTIKHGGWIDSITGKCRP
jgi:hypothetical protein